jgi:hypothetical protein
MLLLGPPRASPRVLGGLGEQRPDSHPTKRQDTQEHVWTRNFNEAPGMGSKSCRGKTRLEQEEHRSEPARHARQTDVPARHNPHKTACPGQGLRALVHGSVRLTRARFRFSREVNSVKPPKDHSGKKLRARG